MMLSRLLVLSSIIAGAFAQPGKDFDSPLIAVRDEALVAAQLSQDVYGEGLGSNGASQRLMSSSSSMLFSQGDGICYFAFGGMQMGFYWLKDIKPRGTYISSGMSANKRRRCRILKSSKQMWNDAGSYLDEVGALITGCGTDQIMFTGHGIGGTLATVFAVYYEQMSTVWAVTFGAAPTFVPPQYSGLVQSSGYLRSRPGRKSGCRYMNFDQYIPIVNTGPMEGGLSYDPVHYLNFVLYSMLNDATFMASVTSECFLDAAEKLDDFGGRGNAGHPWGQYVLLPPSATGDFQSINYFQYPQPVARDRDFSLAMPAGLTTAMMDIPASCDVESGSVHDIADYIAKLEELGSVVENAVGLSNFVACNFDFECSTSSLYDTADVGDCGSITPGECNDPGNRNPRKDDDDF